MSMCDSAWLEIKRADQVDVLPRIGRNLFDDLGGSALTGKLQQPILVDALAKIEGQLDCPDSLEAFDMDQDVARTWYA